MTSQAPAQQEHPHRQHPGFFTSISISVCHLPVTSSLPGTFLTHSTTSQCLCLPLCLCGRCYIRRIVPNTSPASPAPCCHHDCASCLMRFLTSWVLSYCLPSAVKSCSCKRSDNHSVPPLWHLTPIFLGWTPGGNCHHQPQQCLKSPPGTGTAVGVLGACHAS